MLLIIFCLFDNFGINIQAKKADKNIIGIYHSEKLNNFFSKADELQIKLIILLIGETLPHGNNINGIRFFCKTKLGYHINVMFKLEIQVNKNINEGQLKEIKKILSKEFGYLGTIKSIQ